VTENGQERFFTLTTLISAERTIIEPAFRRTSEERLAEHVSERCDQDAGTPSFAPYPFVARTRLRTIVVTGVELSVIYPELAREQMQLLHARVDVRWVVGFGRESNQHADEMSFRICSK
jgi:hypothetical protein